MAQTDRRPDQAFRGRATIRDIADLAGVSIATVSRVLNDRPDVAAGTRETVLQVVREHGFTTNRGARGLSSGRTGMIGLTLPLVNDAYFGPMLSGATEALYESDLRIVLCPTLHEHDREVSLLERLMRGTTDGAILMLPEESLEELSRCSARAIPSWSSIRASVRLTGSRAWRRCTPKVPSRRRSTSSRSVTGASARSRAAPAGTRPRSGCSASVPHSPAPGILLDPELSCTRTGEIRRARSRPTNCCRCASRRPRSSDSTTTSRSARCMRRVRAGSRVPEDLSVVGFDDTAQAVIVTPQLTSVSQPLAELGRTGVSLLTRLLDGQRVDALRMELSTKLVVRESTAPPRQVVA